MKAIQTFIQTLFPNKRYPENKYTKEFTICESYKGHDIYLMCEPKYDYWIASFVESGRNFDRVLVEEGNEAYTFSQGPDWVVKQARKLIREKIYVYPPGTANGGPR